jgi:hypothetical protein
MYAYQKLMEEHKLSLSDLPEDAKVGIKTIQDIEKAVRMSENKGQTISPATLSKIKANDKWVCNEILDYLDDKDTNSDELPHDKAEVIEDIKDDAAEAAKGEDGKEKDDVLVNAVYANELKELHASGVKVFTLDELKSKAPKCYAVIWDGYEEGAENGIETPKFKLLETEKENFTLTSK